MLPRRLQFAPDHSVIRTHSKAIKVLGLDQYYQIDGEMFLLAITDFVTITDSIKIPRINRLTTVKNMKTKGNFRKLRYLQSITHFATFYHFLLLRITAD